MVFYLIKTLNLRKIKMKTTVISSIEEAEALVKDGVLRIDGDLEITCEDFVIEADIEVKGNIKACNVEAGDIIYYESFIFSGSCHCASITIKKKYNLVECLDQEIEYIK
jgi:hypothetical protein